MTIKKYTVAEVRQAVDSFFIVGTRIELSNMSGVVRSSSQPLGDCSRIDWLTLNGYEFSSVEKIGDIDRFLNGETHVFDLLAQSAWIAGDRVLLRKRLAEARSVMKDEWQDIFKGASFDFDNARIVSKPIPYGKSYSSDLGVFGGHRYSLSYFVRREPMTPPSYENQQTSNGATFILSDPFP